MGTAGDDVALTDWERAVLARLESELQADDPGLARRLGGRPSRGAFPVVARLRHLASSPRQRVAAGMAAVAAGFVLMLLTVAASTLVAFCGVLAMAAGLGAVWEPAAARLRSARLVACRSVLRPRRPLGP